MRKVVYIAENILPIINFLVFGIKRCGKATNLNKGNHRLYFLSIQVLYLSRHT